MNDFMEKIPGMFVCILIATLSYVLGTHFPVIGGPVFGILIGMVIGSFWSPGIMFEPGIKYSAKYILQLAVIFLGFGLNLHVILETGSESLPIIISTITTSLVIAWLLQKKMHIPTKIATLIGVGSSICGGSAIAATAPVIDADDSEVAQAISVIFLFNVIAAILFPILGQVIGFSTTSGDAFGIFAGTAVNDTSSVTAAAATWDSMWNLGSQTLDKAVMVKLTRTLAIIPITLVLGMMEAKKTNGESKFSLKKAFPTFILFFVLASIITTVAVSYGVDVSFFKPMKSLSKFMIIMAMTGIGINSDIVDLVKTGGKPILLGLSCWTGITLVTLVFQHFLGLI